MSDPTSGRRVEARTFAPPDALGDVVAALWAGRWDLPSDAPHTTELLSDPCVHVVFERGEGPSAGARLVGVWTQLWRRRLVRRGYVRGAKLRAGAVRAFVDAPAHRFSDRIVPLDEVVDDDLVEVEARIMDPEDDEAGLLALASWLAERRREDDGSVSFAVAVAQRIADEPGITSVEALAEVAGVGPRALQRLFREHLGAPPKWVIRRHRLQEAAVRIERGDGPTLAALAAELGYADQAHLARDFKRSVGKTPSALASSLRPT